MCKIARISAALAILGWLGGAQTAFGQAGSSGPAGNAAGGPGNIEHVGPNKPMPAGFGRVNSTSPGSLITSPNNLEQQANAKEQAAAAAAASAPTNTQMSLGGSTTTATTSPTAVSPYSSYYGNWYPGVRSYYYTPGVMPGSPNGSTRVAPGYAGTGEPGMKYTSVNPYGVTMPLGSWYSGLPVMPYRYSPTNAYNSSYMIPGYAATGQTYTTTNAWGTYVPQTRPGFPGGGMFGPQRDWTAYPTVPYSRSPGAYYYNAVPGAAAFAPGTQYYGVAPNSQYYGSAPRPWYTYRPL